MPIALEQLSASAQTTQASLSAAPATVAPTAGDVRTSTVAAEPQVALTPEQEIQALKLRVEQLERLIERQPVQTPAAAQTLTPAKAETTTMDKPVEKAALIDTGASAVRPAALPTAAASIAVGSAVDAAPAKAPVDPHLPAFTDWDWTWLNGNPRNKDVAFDSKFFTPEIRADITYNYDFNKPIDDSMSGSSELFRANEIQVEQLGLGGDFHYDHAHVRFMTQFGMYSTATVRNDPSYSKGQWDIADADRYFSEMYGGYQFTNVAHGLNIDAGIFMSYIGLFSYYNFDNWAYQPSYVSSNTPWFFEGVRIQYFPTTHIKIEPWIINGWQSYGSSNSRKGLGGQFKWTPYPWMNIISNNYGLGHDDFTIPGRGRLHTDNSLEIKYYDHPDRSIDKMAFSLTADAGCEFGKSQTSAAGWYQQGVGCHGNTKDPNSIGSAAQYNSTVQYPDPAANFAPGVNPKQSFIGYMLYNRLWWGKDKHGLTIGGGQINNPGRYLVLVPAINGETATTAALGAPYFSGNPSDPFRAWDSSITYDFMPKEWLTWRFEYDYRHSSVPYWSGHGGSTPPSALGSPTGVNNGQPSLWACMDGTSATFNTGCGNDGGLWRPDLRRDEQLIDVDLMVKF
jgi:hypothetical protein